MAGFVLSDRIGTVGKNLWTMCKECEAQGTPKLFKFIDSEHTENAHGMAFQDYLDKWAKQCHFVEVTVEKIKGWKIPRFIYIEQPVVDWKNIIFGD